VIDPHVELLAPDGLRIGSALAAGAADSTRASRPSECRHVQAIDSVSCDCGCSLIKIVRARHGCEELLDIAGLIGGGSQCIPRRSDHGNSAGTIRLRESTAIKLYVSKYAIATQASRVRAAVWIPGRRHRISEQIDDRVRRRGRRSREGWRYKMRVGAVVIVEVPEDALPRCIRQHWGCHDRASAAEVLIPQREEKRFVLYDRTTGADRVLVCISPIDRRWTPFAREWVSIAVV